jgi:hypothetical protein
VTRCKRGGLAVGRKQKSHRHWTKQRRSNIDGRSALILKIV